MLVLSSHPCGRVRKRSARLGGMQVIMVMLMFATMGIACYAINVVHMEYVRTELQVTTDMSTRAACRILNDTKSTNDAVLAAQIVSTQNLVNGDVVAITTSDMNFYSATRGNDDQSYTYDTASTDPNAVELSTAYVNQTAGEFKALFPSPIKIDFQPARTSIAIQSELDLIFVLDCSSSMLLSDARDNGGLDRPDRPVVVETNTPWGTARSGILKCLAYLEQTPHDENVGLVIFPDPQNLTCDMSTDYAGIKSLLGNLGDKFEGGPSNLTAGLDRAINDYVNGPNRRAWASRVMFVLSDGWANEGTHTLPAQCSSIATNEITCHSIVMSHFPNSGPLELAATAGAGQVMSLHDDDELKGLLSQVTKNLPILLTK